VRESSMNYAKMSNFGEILRQRFVMSKPHSDGLLDCPFRADAIAVIHPRAFALGYYGSARRAGKHRDSCLRPTAWTIVAERNAPGLKRPTVRRSGTPKARAA